MELMLYFIMQSHFIKRKRGEGKNESNSFIKKIIYSMCFLMLFSVTASAGTVDLWRHSASTFVSSYHGDDFWADTYVGTASVKGADRIRGGDGIYGFSWTEFTYDVQGDITNGRAYSWGINDTTPRSVSKEVPDKWNDGTKTRVYYDYGLTYVGLGTAEVEEVE